ncbi:hypothetical protein HYH03_003058 [Edaphochlamys debaryana]|uniref:Uncharacterized protein n=1 Tax=Edaphochlamys debaryana TaxID=47281 RepID=A0A836C397_9CHLO|nr:hypothetical protein HYH03_003058 [Edaphochlamys debaryana]|eukprot:KAG2498866.1 hypothetical protein HYH03_003058 [Edaphochlamys debaryana]
MSTPASPALSDVANKLGSLGLAERCAKTPQPSTGKEPRFAESPSTAVLESIARGALGRGTPATPPSPTHFTFTPPKLSQTLYTPNTGASRRGPAGTPPRTPEERVLRVLADEDDASDAEECCSLRGMLLPRASGDGESEAGSPARRRRAGVQEGGEQDDDDDSSVSSGDELDEGDLERMGITPPHGMPASRMCHTPVQDLIDLMLRGADTADDQEEAEAGP